MTEEDWATEPETRQLRALQTAMVETEIVIGRRMHLRPSDLAAMGHLTFADAPLNPSELSTRLGMTPPAVTELIDRLERAGHVDRRRDGADRRRVNVVPTARALAEVRDELGPLLAVVDTIVQRYDAANRAVIGRFLDEVVAAYTSFASEADS